MKQNNNHSFFIFSCILSFIILLIWMSPQVDAFFGPRFGPRFGGYGYGGYAGYGGYGGYGGFYGGPFGFGFGYAGYRRPYGYGGYYAFNTPDKTDKASDENINVPPTGFDKLFTDPKLLEEAQTQFIQMESAFKNAVDNAHLDTKSTVQLQQAIADGEENMHDIDAIDRVVGMLSDIKQHHGDIMHQAKNTISSLLKMNFPDDLIAEHESASTSSSSPIENNKPSVQPTPV